MTRLEEIKAKTFYKAWFNSIERDDAEWLIDEVERLRKLLDNVGYCSVCGNDMNDSTVKCRTGYCEQ